MPYLLPPASFPLSLADIVKIIKSRFSSEKYCKMFKTSITELTGAKYCFLFNLGRTALYHTLKAIVGLSDSSKTEVVIPAYTCFTVAAPIARIGLKIRLVDIDPSTMDFNYKKLSALDYKKILAVVPSNLFGIISNWNTLWSIARDNSVYLIDDAAQAMGSKFCNRPAGSLGDAGIFSLDRGKPLSTYLGGIMVTNNDRIAESVKKNVDYLTLTGAKDELLIAIKLIFYAIMSNPRLYWLPDRMPFLKLGQTVFDEHFGISDLSVLQSCAGAVMFPKLDNINTIRTKNARKMARKILGSGLYNIPGYREDLCPAYLRLPLLAPDKASRDRAIRALRGRGVVATSMYPSTIRQIPGIERHLAYAEDDFSGAQEAVERLFTLPTHPYLSDKDIREIVSCLVEE